MGVDVAIFESAGKRTEHLVPGAYTRSDNVASPSGVSAGNHVVMGRSDGGEPLKLLVFSSLSEARDVLKGGELLKAVSHAFTPSPVYTPQKVYAMRVNTGTQSTIELVNGVTPVLRLKSHDYGAHANQLKIWIQSGTKSGKKITVAMKDEEFAYDDVGQNALTIEYTGSHDSATVAVTDTAITLTGGDDEQLVINFADYETVADVVRRINDSAVYVASVADGSDLLQSVALDTLASASIKDSAQTLTANLYAATLVLEQCPLIGSIEFIGGTTKVIPDNTTSFTYFTGGTAGEYAVTQWMEALSNLEANDIQIISTPSTDSAVQTLIANHCIAMNGTEARKERTCILGGPLDEADDAAMTKAKGFNSKFVSYVVDSATVADPITGATEKINGAMLGVKLAAIESAMAVNEPITNKPVSVLGFSKHRSIANMGNLIQAGVITCNPSPDNPAEYVCIRAVTTYQGTGDLISCERSMVREDLYMNRDIRSKFRLGVGRPNNASISAIEQTLKDAAREWATNGYLIPKGSDNVWNIRTRISGDKVILSFSRYLTAPRNFVFITATNHVYDSSVEL
jgi:hypothetical protein